MDEQLKANLTSSSHWIRFLYMLLFTIFLQLSMMVMWVCVVLQFIVVLVFGEKNDQIASFSSSLTQYISQIIKFLTFESDSKVFPFIEWPESQQVNSVVAEVADTNVVAESNASEQASTQATSDESVVQQEPQTEQELEERQANDSENEVLASDADADTRKPES